MAITERSFVLLTTFIEVLAFSDILVYFVLAMTMTYLTDVWDMSILHAGAVINIASGAMEIMPCVLERLSYGHHGIQRLAYASAFSYVVGLTLLAMSLPSVLPRYTGTCSDYKSECIGNTQKYLLYIGLAFASFGGAAYRSSVEPLANTEFLQKVYNDAPAVENMFQSQDDTSCSTVCTFLLGFLTELALLVIIILLGALNPWSPRYWMAAVVLVFGLIAFLCSGCGNPFEYRKKPIFRFWFITMTPLWLTYIALGVVSSVGNTYFSEQADKMKPLKLGQLKIGYSFILWISCKTSNCVKKIYSSKAEEYKESKLGPAFTAIGMSMVMAVLCCITAARVEARRLGRIGEMITVFWMLPQLMLLGVVDGLCEASAHEFLLPKSLVPEPVRPYARILNKCVFGVGTIGASASVYLVGKASEEGGTRSSWFQHGINQSRLDNYYWVLATYSAVNLMIFIFVAACFSCAIRRDKKDRITLSEFPPVVWSTS